MLLWQGVYSFEWWFGCQAPVAAMRSGLAGALALALNRLAACQGGGPGSLPRAAVSE